MAIEVNPDEDFHVVLNGNVHALSLNALDAAYQGDRVDESTLIWQKGFGEWMRLDAVLGELERQEGAAPPPEEVPGDVYFVMVAEGDIKQMSLDLLNDAYRMDIINDDTLVWQPGYTEWIPLAVVIGEASRQDHVSISPSMPARPPSPASQAPGAPAMPPAPSQRPAPGMGSHMNTLPAPGALPSPSARPPSTGTIPGSAPPPQNLSASVPPPRAAPGSAHPSASPAGVASAPPPSASARTPGPGNPAASVPPPSVLPARPAVNQASPFGPSPYDTAPSSAQAPVLSTAPVSLNVLDIPQPPPRPSPWYSRGLVAIAACTMLFVANQNGVAADVTHDLVQGSAAESSLVGRSTPYGLELWLAELEQRYHLDRLSDTKSILEEEPKPEEPLSDDEAKQADEATDETEHEQSEEKPSAASSGSSKGSAAAFGARLNKQKPAPPTQRRTTPVARPRPAPAQKSKSGLPTTADSYDPMNGAL